MKSEILLPLDTRWINATVPEQEISNNNITLVILIKNIFRLFIIIQFPYLLQNFFVIQSVYCLFV
jgi:hypothetical protein